MKKHSCPSSIPDLPNSIVFGVVEGTVTAPRVTYLSEPQPATAKLLAQSHPVAPTEVFRFAASCIERGCQHFQESKCQLARRIVDRLPEVTVNLPPCSLRQHCRWWAEEGKAVCLRCPQIVRTNYSVYGTIEQVIKPQNH
ncbi:MAG: nitrogen fixation protein [Okeania sp. SIO2H7]|nr:nitrogen fixation protein [Okeania sp. SIO2H7]